MLSNLEAILFGALQGFAELFPISSLGHTVILPQIFRISVNQHSENFVVFIVATHMATALVLLGFFYKDWLNLAKGFFRTLKQKKVPEGDTHAKIAWLLIVGTVPAGALGFLLQKKFEAFFARPSQAAFFLLLNGIMLYGAETLRRKREGQKGSVDENIAKLSYKQAFGIGGAQALALFPGISRTGSALAGGLLAKLSHEESARFAFLLATPIISAAAVLKLPKLLHADSQVLVPILLGSLASGVFAFVSISFLSKYFKTKTLTPFAVYCVIAGALAYVFIG